MTTLSFKDFAKGGNVSVVGNEGKVLKNEKDNGNSFMEGISRVASTYGKNLKEQAIGGVENAQKTIGMGVDTMQQAQQIPLDTNANQDKAIMTGAAGAAQIGAGAMSGVIQTAFSPLTALVMTGVQGYKELDEATGGNMKNQLTQVAQANPELIRNISDYVVQNPKKVQFASDMLNILTAGLGGKAVGEAGKDLTKGLVTGTKEAIGSIPTPSVPGVITDTVAKVLPTSESIMQRVARIPKGEQAKFERITGESVGSYLDKRGIYGEPDKIVEQLYNRFQQSKSTADQALETIQGTYRSDVLRTTLKELEGKVQRTSSPGAPDSDLARISELVNKERTTGLSMHEINEVKRLYERKVKFGYLKEQNVDAIDRATNIDRSLREWQMKEAEKAGLTNLAEINKETQATRQLMDALGKEQAGIAGNNALGLTDAILVAGGSPESIASLVTKKVFSDKGMQSYVAKKMSKNSVKQGVPEAKFKEKLQLPSPSKGTSQSSNNVPINLNKVSTTALDNQMVKKFGKTYEQISGDAKNFFDTYASEVGNTGNTIKLDSKNKDVLVKFLNKIDDTKIPLIQMENDLKEIYNMLYDSGIEKYNNIIKYVEGGKNSPYKVLPEMGVKSNRNSNGRVMREFVTVKDKQGRYVQKEANPLKFQNKGDTFIDEIGFKDKEEAQNFIDSFSKIIETRKNLKTSKTDTLQSLEKVLQSSPQSTPTTPKSKGIRGMINASEIKKALTPSELSNATLKAQKVNVVPSKDTTKMAKGLTPVQRGTIADFLDDTASLDNELKLRKMFGYMGLDENMSKVKLEQTASILKDENIASKKKAVSSLEQEAKKYKSAEEFVKAQGTPVYHGTTQQFDKFDNAKIGSATDSGMWGSGFYFTNDAKYAQTYTRGKGEVKEVYLDLKNPYRINSKADIPKIETPKATMDDLRNADKNYSKMFRDYLLSKGYDGVIYKDGAETVVFDSSQIKTKKELLDIWNKNKK